MLGVSVDKNKTCPDDGTVVVHYCSGNPCPEVVLISGIMLIYILAPSKFGVTLKCLLSQWRFSPNVT